MARMHRQDASPPAEYHPGPSGVVGTAGADELALGPTPWTSGAEPEPVSPPRSTARGSAIREAATVAAVVALAAITVLLGIRAWAVDALVVRRVTVATSLARGGDDAVPVATDSAPRPDSATTAAEPAARKQGVVPGGILPLPSIPGEVVEVPFAVVAVDPGERRRAELVRPEEFSRLDTGRARPELDRREPDLLTIAGARREAERAVDAFAGALRRRDLAALERAAPDMSSVEHAQWSTVFGEASAVDAQMTVTDVRLDVDVIVASVRSRIDVRVRGRQVPKRFDTMSTATLARDSSGWRLRSLR